MGRHHLALQNSTVPACGVAADKDPIVGWDEAHDPAGRYYDCPKCHDVESGGVRHVIPPSSRHDQDGDGGGESVGR